MLLVGQVIAATYHEQAFMQRCAVLPHFVEVEVAGVWIFMLLQDMGRWANQLEAVSSPSLESGKRYGQISTEKRSRVENGMAILVRRRGPECIRS